MVYVGRTWATLLRRISFPTFDRIFSPASYSMCDYGLNIRDNLFISPPPIGFPRYFHMLGASETPSAEVTACRASSGVFLL